MGHGGFWKHKLKLSWHYRQDQRAGVCGVVKDGVCRPHEGRAGAGRLAGIQVAVEAREVTAAYFQSDSMPLQKDIAR